VKYPCTNKSLVTLPYSRRIASFHLSKTVLHSYLALVINEEKMKLMNNTANEFSWNKRTIKLSRFCKKLISKKEFWKSLEAWLMRHKVRQDSLSTRKDISWQITEDVEGRLKYISCNILTIFFTIFFTWYSFIDT